LNACHSDIKISNMFIRPLLPPAVCYVDTLIIVKSFLRISVSLVFVNNKPEIMDKLSKHSEVKIKMSGEL